MPTPRKSIREFALGKIRRSEMTEQLALSNPGPSHPSLGEHQGGVQTQTGTTAFELYREGMTVGAVSFGYREIAAIHRQPLKVTLVGGQVIPLPLSGPEADLCFATLRWVGRALLRRTLD